MRAEEDEMKKTVRAELRSGVKGIEKDSKVDRFWKISHLQKSR